MVMLFAALRFDRDENLADRTYWYACPFPAQVGARVLAPVGPHDKLQCALIERTVEADAHNAPYDVRLIKQIAAPLGARKVVLGGAVCRELGGVLYDEKHYTRLERAIVGNAEDGHEFGITSTLFCDQRPMRELLLAACGARGCVLLTGSRAEEVAAVLLSAAGVSPDRVLADAKRGGADVGELLAEIRACGSVHTWLLQEGLSPEQCDAVIGRLR